MDVPQLEQAIDRNGIVGSVATESFNLSVRMQLFEISQGKNAGDTAITASMEEVQEEGQITFEILVI